MRKRILRFSILVMLVVAVIGAWAVTNKNNYVKAAGDKDITLGEKYALEFDGSDKCWFRLQNNTSKMVKVIANVKEPVEVSLFKGSKDGSTIGSMLCFNEQPNYSLMSYLEQGTYYFQARSLYSNDTYAGATIVFADITDTTPVAAINATNFPNALFRKYVEVNAYDPYKDLYQKEEAHIIKIIDDLCAENYPIYHLKKGCKTEDKCLYSFNSCIPKGILEDNGGLFLIAVNWDKINMVGIIRYEIFDETVEFTKLFI